MTIRMLLLLAFTVATPAAFSSVQPTITELHANGEVLYAQRCAACHDNPRNGIPPRVFISRIRTPEDVVAALSTGVMRQQAASLSKADMTALAVFLTGREPIISELNPYANQCRGNHSPIRPGSKDWNGWGRDDANTRLHPDPGFTVTDIPHLRLKWVFAYPGRSAYGQPVVVGGRVFAGGNAGRIFSLDARSGCTHWSHQAEGNVRTAVVVGTVRSGTTKRLVAFFGGDRAMVYSVDAETGRRLWAIKVDDHPVARVLGTPKLYGQRLYVPVSSNESSAAADPNYRCCSFRGKVVVLDAASGSRLWRTDSITGELRRGRLKENGESILGPAGAAIFSSPAIDAKRGVLYVGTGNAYTNHRETGSDAIHAINLRDGRRRWSRQVLAGDAWIGGCAGQSNGNCPSPIGFDFGFGSSPILIESIDRRPVILAGSKSGILYGFDPDRQGQVLWQIELARGNVNGGILWGPAVEGDRVFVATAEYDYVSGEGTGGLTAVDVYSGQIVWRTPTPARPCAWGAARCAHAQVAAVTAIPGAIFAGSLDGWIRGYASDNGQILWEFDAGRTFEAVNGGKAHGGGIDYGGQIVAEGMLLVHSGSGRQSGNALLAFSIDGRSIANSPSNVN